MLKIILRIACLLSRERVSIQREIAIRAGNKRGNLDMELEELLDVYDKLNKIIKKQDSKRRLGVSEITFLLCFPKSSLNFKNGRKVSVNDLERLRKQL